MDYEINRTYRFLDSEAERQALVADIQKVRAEVRELSGLVSEAHWYTPRYHGWSLAGTLAHLNFSDHVHMFLLKTALVGLGIPISSSLWNRLNDFTAGMVFKRRLLKTTLAGIENYEANVTDFILTLPMDKFTRKVFNPPTNSYVIVERVLQDWFLFHWQEHLRIVREVEGIPYEPPDENDSDTVA